MKSLKSVNNKNNSSFAGTLNKRLRESILLCMGAVSLYLLLALVTYDPADSLWFGSHTEIANAGGQMGAFLSGILLSLLGYSAYLSPGMIFYAAWLYFHSRNQMDKAHFSYFIMLRTTGLLFVFLTGCALTSLHLSMDYAGHHTSAGGLLGKNIAHGMVSTFNNLGTNLILTALFLIGITLFTGFSWLKAADFLGERVFRGTQYLRTLLTRIDQWAVNSTEKGPPPLDLIPPQTSVSLQNLNLLSPDEESEFLPTASKSKPKIHRIEPKIVDPAHLTIEPNPNEPFISAPPISKIQTLNKPTPRRIKEESISLFEPPLAGTLPPISLLDPSDKPPLTGYSNQQLEDISKEVELRLRDFGIQVKVVAVHPGPVVTRFELQLAPGTKVSRITALAKDLARSLSAVSVRIVEVIPGKSVIGLELPNIQRETVRLREILASERYQNATSALSLALGKDISGHPIVVDLAKMPHLLVAGTTGSGKSVGLNAMLLSLLYKATPEHMRMILIDPKMLELSVYEGIPHLLTPVVTDMKDAANALRWAVAEMERRYRLMATLGVRNLVGYNTKIKEAQEKEIPIPDPFWEPTGGEAEPAYLDNLPFIVILVDEFADMMMVVGKKVEELIARIAQKARAAGIHLILATQRPSVDVITGLIKANIPTRIAFQVSSKIDSRTILDQQGAEQLLGHGDMLYLPPGTGVPIRIHGAFVADEEVHRVVHDLKRRGQPNYLLNILEGDNPDSGTLEGFGDSESTSEQDPLYDQAVQIVLETRRASISHIQRRLRIGYNRAANIVEAMQAAGVVSSMDQSGGREVLAPEPATD